MPATNSDIGYYEGVEPAPANDVDPYGGDINDSAELVEATPGILIQTVPRPSSGDEDYYGVGIRRNDHATSDWTAARITNRAGANLNSNAGQVSAVSDNPLDVGTIRVVGKISGSWDTEEITLNGTTTVFGLKTWDAGEVWRYEHLEGGAAAEPVGIISLAVDGEITAAMYGSSTTFGNNANSAEWEVACATAQNTAIDGDDRKSPPASGIGSFSRACKWTGAGAVDDSIAIPGDDLAPAAWIAYCVHYIAKANIPAPISGKVFCDISLPGVGA